MLKTFRLCFALALIIAPLAAFAQANPRDARADGIILAAKAAGLTMKVSDQTQTGTAIWFDAGKQQTADATLALKGTDMSALTLNAANGASRREVRTMNGAIPAGQVTDISGNVHPVSLHNSWVPAAWFSPAAMLDSGGWLTLD